MPDTVKVPLLGPTPKGGVFAGLIAVAGVGGYLLYKHLTKAKTAPVTGTPSAYGYGSSAYGYGGYAAYGYGTNSPYGTYGFGGGSNPYGYGGGGTGGPGPITTNAQWGQAAESAMGSSGSDSIAAAISKYLFGAPVTQDQELVIQEAIAVVGYPPVPATSGYPPKIHVTKGGGGGGGGNAVNPVTGLQVTKPGTTGVDIGWNPSNNATSYQVTSTHGNVGMTGTTSARIHSIGRHTTATVSVLAEPAAQGATPATLQVQTN